MEIAKLERLGLSTNEAKIYVTLLEIGESQAGRISKKSQINRTTTYDSIERLIDKGLITFVIQANKKIFKPIPPNKLLENIEEQEKIAKEILPELDTLYKESKEEEESNIYKGRKGIRSILHDILKCKDYVAFGSSGRFIDFMRHDFSLFQKRKNELNIKSRVILSDSARNTEQVKTAYATFRFIPNEYTAPTTTFVYGIQVAIMVWSETPVATVINSKELAKSYKSYFELLWKIAKK